MADVSICARIDPTQTAECFRARFGTTPRLFRAPGRINIIGEHTDYCEGLVMPAAIDRACIVAAAPNKSRFLRVYSGTLDEMREVDLGAPQHKACWIDYVAGIACSLAEAGLVLCGADLFIDSDVPIGAGVSSSAALEIAVAKALTALIAFETDGTTMAQWAQRAENRFVGMPSGIMDQFVSVNGLEGHALMLDCRSLDATPIRLPKNLALLVVHSMARHVHVQGEYRTRREECEMAASLLGVKALRDVAEDRLDAALPLLPEALARRCRHVVTENARVERAAAALRRGDTLTLGRLLNESHASLRDDMEVSVADVDRLAEIAQATQGILGARLMGGGFGGCVIAIAETGAAVQAMERIVDRYGAAIGQEPDAFLCRASPGASEIFV